MEERSTKIYKAESHKYSVRHKKARKKKRAENKARSEQRRLEKGKQYSRPVKQNKLGYKKRLMELVPFGFNASLMQKLQTYPELHDYVWRAENLYYRQSRARQLADMKATYKELNKDLLWEVVISWEAVAISIVEVIQAPIVATYQLQQRKGGLWGDN